MGLQMGLQMNLQAAIENLLKQVGGCEGLQMNLQAATENLLKQVGGCDPIYAHGRRSRAKAGLRSQAHTCRGRT